MGDGAVAAGAGGLLRSRSKSSGATEGTKAGGGASAGSAAMLARISANAACSSKSSANPMRRLASDHSPCPPPLKQTHGDFFSAWGGIASLELSLAALWTAARPRGFTPADLARWMSAAPARLAGLEGVKGAIAPGADADLVVFDPDAEFVVDATRLRQRHPLTPYAGRTLRGRVERVFRRGEPAFPAVDAAARKP